MFSTLTIIYNTHADELGLPKSSGEGVKVSVQDSKLSFTTVDEKVKYYGFAFNNRLKTPADFIVEENDDLTYDEAIERYEDNVKFFETYDVQNAPNQITETETAQLPPVSGSQPVVPTQKVETTTPVTGSK